MYREGHSKTIAAKQGKRLIGQFLEERRGDVEHPLSQPYGARAALLRGNRAYLRDRLVPLAQQDAVPFPQSFEVAGQVRAGVFYVHFYHGDIVAGQTR